MGMNPEIKAEWIKRLREPDRKQIRGKLQTDLGQCCLGVLCEIAVEQGVIEQRTLENEVIEYDGVTRMPTSTVAEWAGLDVESGWDLVYRNDVNVSFSKIADIIENQL